MSEQEKNIGEFWISDTILRVKNGLQTEGLKLLEHNKKDQKILVVPYVQIPPPTLSGEYLKGKRCYISGAIECDDSGFNWRTEPTRVLTEEFGIDLFDPFADIKQQWVPALKKAREEHDIETIVKITRTFVRKDLHEVDKTEFVIAYLPYKVLTTGTHHEIINSNNAKKPTLLVTDGDDITRIPLWYFGFIPVEFMFPNWDALYDYLREVNAGKHRDNFRWSYVYGDI